MDNDDKIIPAEKNSGISEHTTHESVRLFLAKELAPLEERTAPPSYNLSEEYAKTQKNKNRRVWLLLALCFVSVGICSFGITLYISEQNKKIEVNINAFDDLNLRTLLSNVGRTQNLYEEAAKKKESLKNALENALKQADRKREDALFTTESIAPITTRSAIKRRAEAAQKEYDETVQALHEKYDKQIQAAEKETAQYAKQLESYDGAKITRAQEQEAAIDSQKQLHDLEMKSLSSRYEKQIADLRAQMVAQQKAAQEAQRAAVEEVRRTYQARIDELDPFVRDTHGKQVVTAAAKENAASRAFAPGDYTAGTEANSRTLTDALTDTGQAFADFDYITGIVSGVPQEHDIPSFVQAMKNKTYQIGTTLATAAQTLQKENDTLSSKLALTESYLDAYLVENDCDGLVLDATNKTIMPLRLTAAAAKRAATGAAAAQIRDGKKVIAELIIQTRDGSYFATYKTAAEAAQVTTFAKVYLLESDAKKK